MAEPPGLTVPHMTVKFRQRIELRRRKQSVRVLTQALAAAQRQGDPNLPGLVEEHVARARQVKELATGIESGSSPSLTPP